MKKLIVQFLKFAVVGGLAFLIDAGIYVGLTALFGDRLHLLFNILSFSVSVIFNYICSMRFVFKGKAGMSRRTEMLIFILLSVIGLGINEAVMWLLVDVAHIEGAVQCLLRGMAGEKIGQAISPRSWCCSGILSAGRSFWRRRRTKPEPGGAHGSRHSRPAEDCIR